MNENNLILSKKIIEELIKFGVEEFVLCAGKRNLPLLQIISKTFPQKCYFHFEERSAAFFALGRIKSHGKPVAVCTTSGTAVGELLPATMEAFYSGLPLVLLSADREKKFRGSGAPQTADQPPLLSVYVSKCLDLDKDSSCVSLISTSVKHQPLHINVCLEEPGVAGEKELLTYLPDLSGIKTSDFISPTNVSEEKNIIPQLNAFLQQHKHLLVIVGQLPDDEKLRKNVKDFLLTLSSPVLLESLSGLRECQDLQELRITVADKFWRHADKSNFNLTGVIRIGGMPTHRIWRDLTETKRGNGIDIFSLSHLPFSGTPEGKNFYSTSIDGVSFVCQKFLTQSLSRFHDKVSNEQNHLLESDKESYLQLRSLLQKFPESEPALLWGVSEKLTSHSNVYLGNSLPIREWDMVAQTQNMNVNIEGSRGVNGIDGQISTFLGFCRENQFNVGVFGDLTAMYDLAGLWVKDKLKENNISFTIIIINNQGSQLFENMSFPKEFQSPHKLGFEGWANLFAISYKLVTSSQILKSFKLTQEQEIWEIRPSDNETRAFWKEFQK